MGSGCASKLLEIGILSNRFEFQEGADQICEDQDDIWNEQNAGLEYRDAEREMETSVRLEGLEARSYLTKSSLRGELVNMSQHENNALQVSRNRI